MKSWIPMLVICVACQTAPRPTTTAATNDSMAAVTELAARRAQMIEYLREYYEAGQYPTDDAGRVISVFRDTKGVRCPMAELIHRSGHGDLVDAVVAENNEVRLADVKSGPLYDWMLASGLTGEEIAMVQGIAEIDYGWMQIDNVPQENQTILAKSQVRGRLETAVSALQTSTAGGLELATRRLPERRVPVVAAVNGKVLPEAALASRSKVAIRQAPQQLQQLQLVRRGRTYQLVDQGAGSM